MKLVRAVAQMYTVEKVVPPRCFISLLIANQLFAVLIRLQRGLEAFDVCVQFKISEPTYSSMFTTVFVHRVMSSISISFKTKSSQSDLAILGIPV